CRAGVPSRSERCPPRGQERAGIGVGAEAACAFELRAFPKELVESGLTTEHGFLPRGQGRRRPRAVRALPAWPGPTVRFPWASFSRLQGSEPKQGREGSCLLRRGWLESQDPCGLRLPGRRPSQKRGPGRGRSGAAPL